MLARQKVRGGQQRSLEAGPGGRGEGITGDRGLARPDVALQQAQHRCRSREVVPDRGHRGDLVGRELDRSPDPPTECLHECAADGCV